MGGRMSPMQALWRWPLRALVAHALLFVALLVPPVLARRDGRLAAVAAVDQYLGGSALYFVLLLPLVLVVGVALGVVAGGSAAAVRGPAPRRRNGRRAHGGRA